eukprot:431499_1
MYANSEKLEKIIKYIDEKLLNDAWFEKFYQDQKTPLSVIQHDIKNKLLTPGMVPLHQFTTADVCNFIQNWVFSDIDHNKYLKEIKKIFKKLELNGSKIGMYGTYDVQKMVENELSGFMTPETIKIAFDQLHEFIKDDTNQAESQTAEQIAEKIYNFPVYNLINILKDKNIDGMSLIKEIHNKSKETVIARETGWNEEQVHQIQASLLKFNSFTKKQSVQNMKEILEEKEVKSLSTTVTNQIQHIFDSFDHIELLYYQIKNGKRGKIVETFSADLMNKVEDLIENNEEDGFVEKIYDFVAKCFLSKNELGLNEWICGNCGNENFAKYIGGELRNNTDSCSLCGLKQKDSIVLILKNHDTYTMVKNVNIDFNEINEKENNEETDDLHTDKPLQELLELKDDSNILTIIQEVMENKDENFQLSCRDLNNQQRCKSVLKLSKYLLQYKKALRTMEGTNVSDIQTIIQTNIGKKINNEKFSKVFMKCVSTNQKITDEDANLLKANSISIEKDAFLEFTKKQFCNKIKNITENRIKTAVSVRLYKAIIKGLKKIAYFDDFLCNIDMDDVERSWQHILDFHVSPKHGDAITIENIFRFFNKVIHYEDNPTDAKEKCLSIIHHQKRIEAQTKKQIRQSNSDEKTHNFQDDKKLFERKQDYMQHMLDKIHCFLAHSDFRQYLQRYLEQSREETDENELNRYKSVETNLPSTATFNKSNKSKYITDISDSADTQIISYGFGIEHPHPYLKPVYNSIHNEILFNSLCNLHPTQFIAELIKAIRHHQVETENKLLKCRYYDEKYNIIRNETICIRHVLAIVIYTDFSDFCTNFRKTYRMIGDEKTKAEVRKRHLQLYFYSRALFEAIEFFGEEMHAEMKVYHGLNRVMQFSQFTTYFDQPVSTTPSMQSAQQFCEGSGIILAFKAGTEHFDDASKIPKYLDVVRFSDFTTEDERLFYGAYVQFSISDIIEANLTSHSKELLILNMFQSILQNKTFKQIYRAQKSKDVQRNSIIVALIDLITQQQKKNIDQRKKNIGIDDAKEEFQDADTIALQKYITPYGRGLFDFFCNNKEEVVIPQYKSLPPKLCQALLYRFNQKGQMSLIRLTDLFPKLKKVILNELTLSDITNDRNDYMRFVLSFIGNSSQDANVKHIKSLQKIQIKSRTEKRNNKPNDTLKDIVTDYSKSFIEHDWDIVYELQPDDTHNLIFINKKANKQTENNTVFDSNLLRAPPEIDAIKDTFDLIHTSLHKTIFESIYEYLEVKDESKSDEYKIADTNIAMMKTYKILFDILVTCYAKTMQLITEISMDKLKSDQLQKDKRFYSLLNLKHFFNKASDFKSVKHSKENIDIVTELVEEIYSKYCGLYVFLKTEKHAASATAYIVACCEICFHLGAYSLLQPPVNQYALYPLCFVRDVENVNIIKLLKEQNMNNEFINFKTVKMANIEELCVYDKRIHQVECKDIDETINEKICYFTWPAIVKSECNKYLQSTVPQVYITKIWVGINKEIYQLIYNNYVSNQHLKIDNISLQISSLDVQQMPSLFIQIISLNHEYMEVVVTLNEIQKEKRTFFIKECIENMDESTIAQKCMVWVNQPTYFVTIPMDEKHNELYNLGLYEDKNAKNILPNSTQISIRVLKDKNQIPPKNINYKPMCIDTTTVLTGMDNQSNKLNIYWQLPMDSFGDISYKIINDENKEQEMIDVLPYCLSLTSIP